MTMKRKGGSKSTSSQTKPATTKATAKTTKSRTATPKGRDLTRGEAIRLRWGAGGAKGLYVAGRAGLVVLVSALIYLLAMYVSVKVVPNTMVMVQRGTGIPSDADFPLLLAGWIVPSVFMIGLVFVLTVVVMRGLWRWQLRQGKKLRRALVDEPAETTD